LGKDEQEKQIKGEMRSSTEETVHMKKEKERKKGKLLSKRGGTFHGTGHRVHSISCSFLSKR